MATTTKKELIDRIAEETQLKRADVKRAVQAFLDHVIAELGKGNRLEFRDFGVFETKSRSARVAQNPKTLERVAVPPKRTAHEGAARRQGRRGLGRGRRGLTGRVRGRTSGRRSNRQAIVERLRSGSAAIASAAHG
jgi:nucleoid DNA-binding protein